MASRTTQDPEQQPQVQAFVIFNRSFQEPKQEGVDGRFPPSYEEAVGISTGPSSASVYTPPEYLPPREDNVPAYTTWVNPTSQRNNTDHYPRSVYSSTPDTPEPYVSASVVTNR